MPEFLRLIPPAEALARWLEHLPRRTPPGESVPTAEALGRVTVRALHAPHALPPFSRATVDGYAVRAADTHGASAGLPAYLALIGEVPMGADAGLALEPGQAALVHTGGMIPQGADAVVMLEDTQLARPDEIEVLRAVAPGRNVLRAGEDVQPGDLILESGVRLRPQELGGLMALGLTTVEVARRPRVALLSSGDEVVAPEAAPGPGQVRDVNTTTLSALVVRAGGEPAPWGIFPDRPGPLLEAARAAHAACDLLVISAGSSASTRDLTADVIAALGEPGVLVHGVAIRPGKPTILGVADGVAAIGLPGNPVSALIVAGLFVAPVIRRLLGLREPALTPRLPARLTANLPSQAGREDYMPVRLIAGPEGWSAQPVFGASNLIFTLVRADGLVRIPPAATGLSAGEPVDVLLF